MLNAICQLSSQFLQVLEELNNFLVMTLCKQYNVLQNKGLNEEKCISVNIIWNSQHVCIQKTL